MGVYQGRHRLLLLVIVTFMLGACSSSDNDLRSFIDEVSSRAGKPIEPVPEYKPAKKHVYVQHVARRDPFYSTTMAGNGNNKQKNTGAPDQTRQKQPLESFPLDALKMVGILKQNGTIWALVTAPNKVVYKVTVGTYMGKHYGRVTRVSERYIRLVETVREGDEWQKKKVKVDLNSNRVDGKKALSH